MESAGAAQKKVPFHVGIKNNAVEKYHGEYVEVGLCWILRSQQSAIDRYLDKRQSDTWVAEFPDGVSNI